MPADSHSPALEKPTRSLLDTPASSSLNEPNSGLLKDSNSTDSLAQFWLQQAYGFRVLSTVLLFALLLGSLAALSFGPAGWDWRLSIAWLAPSQFADISSLQIAIVEEIRLPRLCLALIIGAVLAFTGSASQALCRNPLADPSIIGVTSGAAVMAVATITFGAKLGLPVEQSLPYTAFAGAILVTLIIYHMASRHGEVNITTLLLVGVALNTACFALIGLFSFFANDSSLRLINYWTMGSLAGASWQQILMGLPLFALCLVGLHSRRQQLNMLSLGESEASYLGVNVKRVKMEVVFYIAFGVGAAVSLSGMIGFVGLIVPHVARLLVGPELQRMMPLSVLLGAFVLLVADWLARTVVLPAELPIGIVTALLGTPVFVYLLRAQQQKGGYA